MIKKLAAVAAMSAAAVTTGVQAESAIPGMYWQDNSISFLYGENFVVEGASQQTWTFEHASGWVWGDVFFFLDYARTWDDEGSFNNKDEGNGSFYYMEFSPRVSLSWLTDADWSYAPIGLKDTKLAFTYEKGNGGRNAFYIDPATAAQGGSSTDISPENYLMGVGFDWDVPGFAFFNTNFYAVRVHNANEFSDRDWTWQVTAAGAYPFSVGEQDFVVDGYVDWRGPMDNGASDAPFAGGGINRGQGDGTLHSVGSSIQMKWDAGKAFFQTPRKLYVGAELNYWNNKYGARSSALTGGASDRDDGADQQAMQLLVKYHF